MRPSERTNMAVSNAISISGEMQSVNPATGEVLRTFEMDSDAAVELKLQRAHDAFQRWRRTSFAERSRLMAKAAEVLEQGKQEYGRTMTLEMGKPLKAAVQEAEKSARACRYYAENAERFLADEPSQTDAAQSFVRHQPLGPVLAVM